MGLRLAVLLGRRCTTWRATWVVIVSDGVPVSRHTRRDVVVAGVEAAAGVGAAAAGRVVSLALAAAPDYLTWGACLRTTLAMIISQLPTYSLIYQI